jgi:hypothetical protein
MCDWVLDPPGHPKLNLNHLAQIPNVYMSTHSGAAISQKSGIIPSVRDCYATNKTLSPKRDDLSLTAYGVRFTLTSNDNQLLKEVAPYLPLNYRNSPYAAGGQNYSLIHTSTASQEAYQLYCNGRRLFACPDRGQFLEHFSSIITLYVAEKSSLRTFIHAGVVGWRDCAILIPGRSFSGKTSLVAELIRAGATYYSDEFAVVDKRGRVHPYARPLQVRERGGHHQTQRQVEEFGGIAGRKPLPVRLVVVSRYKPEARWRPRRLSPGVGLLKLLDNTVSARRSPAIALSVLKQVVSDAVIVCGTRGEASQLIDWITKHFDSGPTR